jgi:anti-sigma regulatory factor (Ser/Thr protein kinase)
MTDELTLQIKANLAAVDPATEAASRWLTDRKAAPDVQYLANLAIEELLTNCIKYSYEDAGEHTIEIRLQISGEELALTVTDDGRPFNPLELPTPDTHLPVQYRPVGGLGIYLLRQMSDRMEYVRTADRNRITIYKSMGG